MSVFTTKEKVKKWLKIPDAQVGDDEIIDDICDGVDSKFQLELDKDIFEQAYSETYNGNGSTRLWLRHGPITAVSLVKINEVPIAAAPNSVSSGFLFDENEIYLIGVILDNPRFWGIDRFWRGHQNIGVDYTAGFNAGNVPARLQQAARKQVAFEYKERDRIGESSKTLGPDQTVSYITEEWAPGVMSVLEKEKEVVPFE